MPKNGQTYKLSECLETLEDTTLYTKQSRIKSFECLQNIFEVGGDVSPTEVQRILTLFVNCMKEDIQSLPHVISSMLSLLTKVEIVPSLPVQDLVPSALGLLHILKTKFITNGTDKLRELTFEVFLSYPVHVLATMVTYNCSEILEVFNNPISSKTNSIKLNKEACKFLHKFLNILPAEQKKQFVNEGIAIWLGDFVPTAMNIFASDCAEQKLLYLECLEELTETLYNIEYFKCPQWCDILECICNNQRYPLIIKTQLQNGSKTWHRLWIIFVKILKNQITMAYGTYGTPINSMLTIVETAFKMDTTNRCLAFQCWDSLIDNFSKETTDSSLPKRIKLLLIPLKLHNAKNEITALSKFFTWWHFIRSFETVLDTFRNEILITFIHFVFGKEASERKPAIVGIAQSYDSVKDHCLKALAEIVGHSNCDCCPDFPKLNRNIMNTLLASNCSDLIYALKSAIIFTSTIYNKSESIKKTLKCVWKAFIIADSEFPTNGVRDLFNELIQILIDLTENYSTSENMPDVIFCLTLTLFENDVRIKKLFSSKLESFMHKIISIITHPSMNDVYKRYETEKNLVLLKPLTDFIVKSMTADWLLNKLSASDSSLYLWTALMNSLKESEMHMDSKTLTQLLMWPITYVHQISENKNAAIVWHTMFNLNVDNICKADLDELTSRCLIIEENDNSRFFILYVTIGLLTNKLLKEEDVGTLPHKLEHLTSHIINKNKYEPGFLTNAANIDGKNHLVGDKDNGNLILPSSNYIKYEPAVSLLVDTIVVMLHKVTSSQSRDLSQVFINCTKNVLRMIVSQIKFHNNEVNAVDPIDANVFIMLNSLFQALENFIRTPISAYCDLVDELLQQASLLKKESPLFKIYVTKIKSLCMNCCDDTLKSKINNYLDKLQEKTVKEFTSPNVKKGAKKRKKTSIVNTVVENGEEYEVVNSNWKFNPKKLTENQKEKFQRKREIPALYQDLSQSQDEFKLRNWKTDSQDTTSSSNSMSNKPLTNDNASSVLKDIPRSDVLPNIMVHIIEPVENFKIEPNAKNDVQESNNIKNDKPNKVKKQITSDKPKSPRMALKDRVFRNVRNLIEKSTLKNDSKDKFDGECHTENVPKTPQPSKPNNDKNLTNSAPSLISADRPSRLKKIPKKFDDAKLFALKKKQNSELKSDTNDKSNNLISVESNKDYVKNLTDKNIDILTLNNIDDSQDVVVQLNVREEQVFENIAQNESKATKVTQQKTIKKVFDGSQIENSSIQINEESEINQKNYDVSHIQNNIDSQDSQKKDVGVQNDNENKSKEKVKDCMVTVELNGETEPHNTQEKDLKTPVRKARKLDAPLTTKESGKKRLRIEKELAIDMVEGHPFLKNESGKRSTTRKRIIESETDNKKKTVTEKLNKSKPVSKTSPKCPKSNKKSKEKDKLAPNVQDVSVTVDETQERNNSPDDVSTNEEVPCSEDVIESSQDSTFTTISVKSTKRTPQRLPIVAVERLACMSLSKDTTTQDLLQESDCEIILNTTKSPNHESKDDIELPQNKTAEAEKNQSELTENMDTETQGEEIISDMIIINDVSPLILSTEKIVGPETQEIAEADTQPNNPADLAELESIDTSPKKLEISITSMDTTESIPVSNNISISATGNNDVIEINSVPNASLAPCIDKEDISSPFKDDAQRKKDFLNNTLEISPIKVQSPDRQNTSPPQETSSDYVVVKLSSPVQSNGEPFDKGSPEFFTEDKVSPDERDQSPPRAEVNTGTGSPSSSLSLKKNRPQSLRPGGRAAHMLGLCVPVSLNTIKTSERIESEEPRKSNASTPVRRNLRVLYNAVGETAENDVDEDHDNFLKFKKTLPSTDSSPSIPILKRKLTDIVDDTTTSPASKRKRVSFHDPPVSTTVSVQKYIEPPTVRSPSSSQKRVERQMTRSISKSPKRLDNAFVKLETVLSKAVESFIEQQAASLTNDTNNSLDVTPAVEVVVTSELNDTDHICTELVDCKDSIENIATELSSPAMKDLFIKELEGKVSTVGDLAKMTELEVNRLCIKAPKVQTAKKVLADYNNKRGKEQTENISEAMIIDDVALVQEMSEEMPENVKMICVETQTAKSRVHDMEIQATSETLMASTQTDIVCSAHAGIQTEISGSETTSDIISSCLTERPDFVDNLCEQLDESSIRKISEKLPTNTIIDIISHRSDHSTSKSLLVNILGLQSQSLTNCEKNDKELPLVKDYLWDRFDSKSLNLFCIQMLQKIHDNPA